MNLNRASNFKNGNTRNQTNRTCYSRGGDNNGGKYRNQVGDGGGDGDRVVDINVIVETIDAKLKRVSQNPPNWSIFRVPSHLRKLTMDSYKLYTPQLVAMGPAHSHDSFIDNSPAHLKGRGFPFQAMEEQKLVYMQSLLDRTVRRDDSLKKCAEAVSEMEQEARSAYADPADRNHWKLVEILLVDACFALELFIKHHEGDRKGPVFCNAWMVLTLQRDMSLLENQIPFPILERIFEVLRPQFPLNFLQGVSLICLTINFFTTAWNLKQENWRGIKSCKHFLDLLLNCHLPQPSDRSLPETKPNFITSLSNKFRSLLSNKSESGKSESRKTNWEQLPTALELSAAGIDFQKSERSDIFDVKFIGSVLTIPQFRIDDQTETVLKNLIAYEQCCAGSTHHITSYVLFMDRLINSWQDVRFLEKKQILTHLQGNSGHVSKLFNNICKEVVLKDDFFFAVVCDKIHRRYRSGWRKRVAVLKRDYFPNMWKVVAFFAAFVLLLLTSLQTVYSILSYYRSN